MSCKTKEIGEDHRQDLAKAKEMIWYFHLTFKDAVQSEAPHFFVDVSSVGICPSNWTEPIQNSMKCPSPQVNSTTYKSKLKSLVNILSI